MKRLLCILLVMLFALVPMLAACTVEESNTSNPQSDVSGLLEFPLEEKKFDTTISILTGPNYASWQFVENEECKSDVINTAVNKRNALIKERYGIEFEVFEQSQPAKERVAELVTTNSQDFQIVVDAVSRMLPLVVNNYFYSLNDLLELNQPWWDQNTNNYLTLSDKIFFVAGNAIFTDDTQTAAVFYNKNIYKDNYEARYGSPYDLVDQSKWTYDLMYSMAKEFGRPDENGQWLTEKAYYGIVTDGFTGATMLMNGSGTTVASKDNQGFITLNAGTERALRAFGYVFDMLEDKATSMYAEQWPGGTNYAAGANMFMNGHALFRIAYLSSLLDMKASEAEDKVDPGVLPIPKFEEEQESYYSGINVYWSDVIGIPSTIVDKLDATCYALELLGYYSMPEATFGKESVTSAYYETTLKLQSVTDDNDSRMLDMICNARIYDLGTIFNWNQTLVGLWSGCLYKHSNSLQASWDSIAQGAQIELDKTIKAYEENIL